MRLVILAGLLFAQTVHSQTDTTLIERGRRFLFYQDSVYSPFAFDTTAREFRKLGLDKGLRSYQFIREVLSPLSDVKLFIYRVSITNPSPHFVIASYADTFKILVKWWSEYQPLIDFFDERLSSNPPLNSQQIAQLANCITEIASPAFIEYRIVSDFEELGITETHPTPNRPPDSLKSLIKPPTLRSTDGKVQVEYYVWTEKTLQRILLSYIEGRLTLKILWTWDSGKRITIM